MKRSITYRIYPTRRMTTVLLAQLELCRLTWNLLIDDRRAARVEGRKVPTRYEQAVLLAEVKRLCPYLGLDGANAQVLQNVATRVDLAFQSYFRRLKNGEGPGMPRYRGPGRICSMTFSQTSSRCYIDEQGRLYVSKVGRMKIRQHRPLPGIPKTATVYRSATGKWFVSFSCDSVPQSCLPPTGREVGIDLGLRKFATLSDGTVIENPRNLERGRKDLARMQKKLEKATVGSVARSRARHSLSLAHSRIANRRKDFINKTVNSLVSDYDAIYIEKLKPQLMGRSRGERRGVGDASWGMFARRLEAKAEEAGRRVARINPAYTSRTCSVCGWVKPDELKGVVFSCGAPECGYVEDRDLNAARNILSVGQHAPVASAA